MPPVRRQDWCSVGGGAGGSQVPSLRLRPQMPRQTPPTSLQILSSPACVCVPLSPAPHLADPRCGTLGPGCPKCVPIPGHVNEKHWLQQNLGSHRDGPAALQRTPCLQSPSPLQTTWPTLTQGESHLQCHLLLELCGSHLPSRPVSRAHFSRTNLGTGPRCCGYPPRDVPTEDH